MIQGKTFFGRFASSSPFCIGDGSLFQVLSMAFLLSSFSPVILSTAVLVVELLVTASVMAVLTDSELPKVASVPLSNLKY